MEENMDLLTLKKELNSRVVTVTFLKKNGDIRVMNCTTDLNQVPPSFWPASRPLHEEKPDYGDQVRVYDVTAQGWRSFLFENVIDIS